MDYDIIAGLYYYDLTIIRYNNNYMLVDLTNGECFGEMSIYYIRSLLNSWIYHRKYEYNMV